MTNNSNTWLTNQIKQIDDYIRNGDIFLVERKRCLKILLDLFRYHFGTSTNLNILDLGCGDGVVTEMFCNRFPENNFYLLDGSAAMLQKAERRLENSNCIFISQAFEEFIGDPQSNAEYDFIFSSNAIHHLSYEEKGEMFEAVYKRLKSNGMFLNSDVIKPNTQKTESLQFKMWVDWINETLADNEASEKLGEFDDVPDVHKKKAENKPSTLNQQLELLGKVSFRDVDCYYKYSVFAVFGGIK